MKIKTVKIVFLFLHTWLLFSHCTAEREEPYAVRKIYRSVKDFLLNAFGRTATEPRYLERLKAENRVQDHVPKSKEFPCRFRSPGKDGDSDLPLRRSEKRPTSVHALRPGDIDVIAAMGDSLTSGNGGAATDLLQVFVENKGISWSIGGQGDWRRYLTLPNIIKVFNPKLVGYSLGDAFAHHRKTQFNAAEIGAMSRDLPYMARELINRMYNDKRVNIKNDWKLITLMIGANDFCLDFCYIDVKKAAESHRRELTKALKILKKNLPRTLINFVIAPDVTLLKNFTGVPPECEVLHLVECPCFFGEPNRRRMGQFVEAIHQWRKVEQEVADSPEWNDSEDFNVVFQTFVKHIEFPLGRDGKTDMTYLSTDCFHFSQKGYARASNALWNNMLEPVGHKSINWDDEFGRFLCPTNEHPYIFTAENSKGVILKEDSLNEESSSQSFLSNLVKRGARLFGG